MASKGLFRGCTDNFKERVNPLRRILHTMSDPAQKPQTASGAAQVSAAKLHVLQLGPIKDRLGDKWPKLSGLVHQLFEAAIRTAQGPRDHFVRLDELSYVVT